MLPQGAGGLGSTFVVFIVISSVAHQGTCLTTTTPTPVQKRKIFFLIVSLLVVKTGASSIKIHVLIMVVCLEAAVRTDICITPYALTLLSLFAQGRTTESLRQSQQLSLATNNLTCDSNIR